MRWLTDKENNDSAVGYDLWRQLSLLHAKLMYSLCRTDAVFYRFLSADVRNETSQTVVCILSKLLHRSLYSHC